MRERIWPDRYDPIREGDKPVNFLLINKQKGSNDSTREIVSDPDIQTTKYYLNSKLPSYKEESRTERNKIDEKDRTIKEMMEQHFHLGSLEEKENRERVTNLDTFYKVCLRELAWWYNKVMSKMIYWKERKKLPKEITFWTMSKSEHENPYNINYYRKNDSIKHIKQYLWEDWYRNIINRFHTKIWNNVTVTDLSQKDKNIFNSIKAIHEENIFDMLRVELTELLAKELFQHIINTKYDSLSKALSTENKIVKNIRIFKSNKLVDMIDKTDFIVCIEYVDSSWEYLTTDSLALDLKINNSSSYAIVDMPNNNWSKNRKLKATKWHYDFFQSDRAQEIDNAIEQWKNKLNSLELIHKTYVEEETDNMEDEIVSLLDNIWGIIEFLNDDINFYLKDWSPDHFIKLNDELYKELENKLLQQCITPKEIIWALTTFQENFRKLYEGIDIEFDLWTETKRPERKELHIGRYTMRRFFDIAFDSIKKYGTINYNDESVQKNFETLTNITFKNFNNDIFKTFNKTA